MQFQYLHHLPTWGPRSVQFALLSLLKLFSFLPPRHRLEQGVCRTICRTTFISIWFCHNKTNALLRIEIAKMKDLTWLPLLRGWINYIWFHRELLSIPDIVNIPFVHNYEWNDPTNSCWGLNLFGHPIRKSFFVHEWERFGEIWAKCWQICTNRHIGRHGLKGLFCTMLCRYL